MSTPIATDDINADALVKLVNMSIEDVKAGRVISCSEARQMLAARRKATEDAEMKKVEK